MAVADENGLFDARRHGRSPWRGLYRPLRPSDTSPKCDDENLGCGFNGPLVGFGREEVMCIYCLIQVHDQT